ncbi:MAG: twin-arginine translocation signal domain-containing protein, partial [Pirellulales bacterium]|nr:twin-arginine translocation signal domain-containing protein [Pirellulales bacterium]
MGAKDAARDQDIEFDACLNEFSDQPMPGLGGASRRDVLKFCAGIAATMGLSSSAGVAMAEAAAAPIRPPVIWLHGQECTGCTESL